MNKAVAVIAGTGVDTQMGIDFLATKGIEGRYYPVSQLPKEQTLFQILPAEERKEAIRTIIKEIKAAGLDAIFVYCNSLSATTDFPALAAEEGIKIITPLNAYALLASEYKRLAIMAANCQGLAGIERTLLTANPGLDVFAASCLLFVVAVEDGMPEEELVEHFQMKILMDYFSANGAEGLILGCTHFPYFKKALAKRTDIKLIDPAETMYQLLLK